MKENDKCMKCKKELDPENFVILMVLADRFTYCIKCYMTFMDEYGADIKRLYGRTENNSIKSPYAS